MAWESSHADVARRQTIAHATTSSCWCGPKTPTSRGWSTSALAETRSIVPLRTSDTGEQSQPAGSASFRLVLEGGACRLQRREPGGEWEQRYLLSRQPRVLADFEAGCHFHQTSPDSNFHRARICTLLTPAGRVTLSELTLIVTTHAERMEHELDDETAVRETLRSVFGIELGE